MNTWRVCAAMGLGLSLASLSCSSSDSDKNDAGSRRDSGSNRDGRSSADAAGGCTGPDGRTYQPGESFTVNCVRYTCQGNDNVTTSGTPCDAGPGTPDARRDAAPDLPAGSDARADGAEVAEVRDAGADGNRDVVTGEAGGSDGLGLDATAPDLLADVTPPPPDVVAPVDEAPPVQCTYLGQKYGVGVSFACDCNTCKCDSSGTIVLVTHNDCAIDAQ